MSKKNSKETTVKDFLDIFLPKLWIILLVGVLLAAIMSVYSLAIKKQTYTASASIYVYANDKGQMSDYNDLSAAERMVNNYVYAIKGDKFLYAVCGTLKEQGYGDFKPKNIRSMMTLETIEDTSGLGVKVTSTDEELARAVACAIIDNIPVALEGKIIPDAPSSGVVSEPDTVKNGKNTVRNAIIAFFVGFILSAIVVWIRSAFDVVIRSAKKIEENLDLPVLGVIPKYEISQTEEGKA